jgi:hypothetical protein
MFKGLVESCDVSPFELVCVITRGSCCCCQLKTFSDRLGDERVCDADCDM